MKELSIAGKATRYDEAISMAKKFYTSDSNNANLKATLEMIFPELKESEENEDERIRQFLIHEVTETSDKVMSYRNMNKKDVLAWLEKQSEHANFLSKIQVGDKVTRNEDGVLVNLSQLNRVAKKDEKQCEQKPAWSEEDERERRYIENELSCLIADEREIESPLSCRHKDLYSALHWLKSLKDRLQPKQEWKQENTGDLSDFENTMMHIGNSFFGQHAGLDPNDTNAIKEQANFLLELVSSKDWSKEDEKIYQSIIDDTVQESQLDGKQTDWLRNIKYRYFPQPKSDWSEEDESMRTRCIGILGKCYIGELPTKVEEELNWLKSLSPRSRWKPSENQMKALADALSLAKNCGEESAFDLRTLHEQLKKLK